MEEKSNLAIQSISQEPTSYTCLTCHSNVQIYNAEYHQQYLCQKILQHHKLPSQNQVDQQLNQDSKLLKQPNTLTCNKHPTNFSTAQKQQPSNIQLISSLFPSLKKTDSEQYDELIDLQEKPEQKNLDETNKRNSPLKQVKLRGEKKQLKNQQKISCQSGLKQRNMNAISAFNQKKFSRQGLSRISQNPKVLKAAAPRLKNQQSLNENKIECCNCGQIVSIELIDSHQLNCELKIECEFCGLPLLATEIEKHLRTCEIKKLWDKEQKNHYSYKEEKYYKGEQDDESQDSYLSVKSYLDQQDDDYSYHNYHNDFSNDHEIDYQWEETKNKHKGLTHSKLGQLNFSSYKKKPVQLQSETKEEDQPCAICYIEFKESQTVIKLPCLHTYHPECVGKWFQTDDRCPMCKVKAV